MKAFRWIRDRVHLTFGLREWEVQCFDPDGRMVGWTGPPFVTRGEAVAAALEHRRRIADVSTRVRNVRTGEFG